MHYHHFRGQAGPGGGDGHDPANCPNMGGGGSSTTPGTDTSGQL
jgi:hypothetical protein